MRAFSRPVSILAAAFATAASSYLVTVVFVSIAVGATSASLGQALQYFAWSAVVLFALLAILLRAGVFRVGVLRTGWVALIAAVVLAIVSAFLGTLITVVTQGNVVSDAVWVYLLGSLPGTNLLFIASAILFSLTLARRVQSALSERLGRAVARTLLVRRPSELLAAGELTHQERVPVDIDLAWEQWEAYVEVFRGLGWTIVEVEPADELPDSVFVEDAVVMLGSTAVLAYPGAESRRGEIAAVASTIETLTGAVKRIEWPGTLDGGDVLKVGSIIYIGRSGRTNAHGVRQFRAIAAELGYTVIAVPTTKVLHLKSAVTALPDGTIIGHQKLITAPTLFGSFIPMPEPEGSHLVVLSDDTVLMAASAPRSVKIVSDLGYRVITVDISEFEKLEGCVTCLSVRIR